MAKQVNEELFSFEFVFQIIGPTNKVVETKAVIGKGKTEAEAINNARAELDKNLLPDHTVSYTGKFKKL